MNKMSHLLTFRSGLRDLETMWQHAHFKEFQFDDPLVHSGPVNSYLILSRFDNWLQNAITLE